MGGPIRSSLEAGKSRPGQKGAEYEAIVQLAVTGLFGVIAVATDHEHWIKSPEQVVPITAPLVRMIQQMPKKTREKLEKNINPILFCAGCIIVAGPDLVQEMRLRNAERASKAAIGNYPAGFRPGVRAPAGPVGPQAAGGNQSDVYVYAGRGGVNDPSITSPPAEAFIDPLG